MPGRPTIWITVGQGPTALALGAGEGCLDIITLIYPFSPLSPSLWETAPYRLKYCLKGPLNPKQTTNIYDNAISTLQMNGSIGEWFRTIVGVRQRCLLSTTLFGGGRVERRCWVNFQCRGVLLVWLMVGQGPVALAVGAGGGLFEHFLSHLFFLFSFSLSLGDGPI